MGRQEDAQAFARAMSVRANTIRVEWPTVAMIAGTYALWIAAGLWLWPYYPVLAIVVMGVLVAQHSSLVHECLHGHPTSNGLINELLVALPLGLVWPYRRFKRLHLQHHADERLTDPFDDPESYYKAVWRHETLPGWFKAVLRANNTMLGRIIFNPLLGSFGLVAMDLKSIVKGDRSVLDAWLWHFAGAAIVISIVHFLFAMPLWLYLLVACWIGQSIIAIRTYAEHQWHETPEGRTIIVERSPLSILFLNNNLHLVHHKLPTAPWYRLPQLFAERRDEWVSLNKGYVFPGYLAMARAWMFKAKEPVAHPALRRRPEA